MLDKNIEDLLNSFGLEGMQKVIDMAQVELFRNYCIHKFNWFKGGIIAHGNQHRHEKTWMRFYIDHGRLPNNILFSSILDNTLSIKEVEKALDNIYDTYITSYGFDIMNPKKELKILRFKLDIF